MDAEYIGSVASLAAVIERLAATHRNAAAEALALDGLNESMAGLLWLLARGDATLSMSDLAQRLVCDPSNVTLLAGQLESRQLAERVPDQRDARRRILRLTARGQDVAQRMLAAVAQASPLARLSESEISAMAVSLGAVTASPR